VRPDVEGGPRVDRDAAEVDAEGLPAEMTGRISEVSEMTDRISPGRWAAALWVCVAVGLPAGVGGSPPAAEPPRAVTAILGAMDWEIALVAGEMTDKRTRRHLGVTFTVGKLKGRPVVLAATGMGKVNASMVTTLLLDHFKPARVLFTGIAGGVNPKLRPGDVVIGEKLAQHDLGNVTGGGFRARGARNPVGGKRNPVMLPSDGELVALAQRVAKGVRFDAIQTDGGRRTPKVVSGVIVTGDIFVGSGEKRASLHKRFGAEVTEMEGAAVAQVCYQQGVPFLVIRGLSDEADENANRDLQRFFRIAAANAAKLTVALVDQLARKPG
jgi:adenosylhomocysteine nucleosidase